MSAPFIMYPLGLSSRPEVVALRVAYGAEGFGVYLLVVEALRAAPNCRLPDDGPMLAWLIHYDNEQVLLDIIHRNGLFVFDNDGTFYCPWLSASVSSMEERRAKLSAAGRRGGSQPKATLKAGFSEDEATAKQIRQDNIIKEKKETQPTPNRGEGEGDFLSNDYILRVGRSYAPPADAAAIRAQWPKDKEHNPDCVLSLLDDYALNSAHVAWLLAATEGARVGSPALCALLAQKKHAKDTQFKPNHPFNYFAAAIAAALQNPTENEKENPNSTIDH